MMSVARQSPKLFLLILCSDYHKGTHHETEVDQSAIGNNVICTDAQQVAYGKSNKLVPDKGKHLEERWIN